MLVRIAALAGGEPLVDDAQTRRTRASSPSTGPDRPATRLGRLGSVIGPCLVLR